MARFQFTIGSVKTWIKYLGLIIALSSYKSLPFAYLFRFYAISFKHLSYHRRLQNRNLSSKRFPNDDLELLRPVDYYTYCSPFECDFYMHKSNSTYFSDLDMSRTELFTVRLGRFFWAIKDETGQFPILPVASVTCHFLKEIKPLAKYKITNEIFAWDAKFIFVVSKFYIGSKLCCLAVTRSVFKKHTGKTIPPATMFKLGGLYSEELEKINAKRYPIVQHYITEANNVQGKIDVDKLLSYTSPKL